jgi:hypothetical protein
LFPENHVPKRHNPTENFTNFNLKNDTKLTIFTSSTLDNQTTPLDTDIAGTTAAKLLTT